MNNSVTNKPKITFNGAFLIDYSRAVKGTSEYMETKVFNNHRNIFRNWNGNPNQVFYVTKDRKDYQVATAIFNNALKAKYFPNINTNLCLDSECPEMLQACLDNPDLATCISGPKRIFNYIEKTRPHNRTIPNSHLKRPKPLELGTEDKIRQKFKLFFETKKKEYPNGVVKFTDKSGQHNALVISPKSKDGNYFVYVQHEKFPEDNRYYMYDAQGELIKRYEIDELREFTRNFDESVRRYKQMHPQTEN